MTASVANNAKDPETPLLSAAITKNYDGNTVDPKAAEALRSHWLICIIKCVGPGLMLGLANSNAGDLLAAAQSGAKYRYLYLTWVTLLIPPLYLSTELVTRICVVNSKPLLVLVTEACGRTWALIAILVLAVSCMGGLVMQICTVVAVGNMWGIGGVTCCVVLTVVFVSIVLTDSVSSMEKFGICLGLFECAFCVSAALAEPDGAEIANAFAGFSVSLQADHATITGAIIGAVMMPWMFFYQGSAVNRNKIRERDLDHERLDISMGTFASQITMGGILITFAIAMGNQPHLDLESVSFSSIPVFLSARLPHAKFLFSMGMVGASFVASLAIALTISWALEEAIGLGFLGTVSCELEAMSSKLGFTASVMMACVLSLMGIHAISMIIFCDIVNSLTVLLIIFFILYLSEVRLPKAHSIVGTRKVLTFGMMLFMGICGFVSAVCHLRSIVDGDVGETRESTTRLKIAGQWRLSVVSKEDDHLTCKPLIYLAVAVPLVAAQFALSASWTTMRKTSTAAAQ